MDLHTAPVVHMPQTLEGQIEEACKSYYLFVRVADVNRDLRAAPLDEFADLCEVSWRMVVEVVL
jgi:hypothetical protein